MSNPSRESEWAAEGANAYAQGRPVDECPYDPYTDARYFWINGWWVADFSEPKKVKS